MMFTSCRIPFLRKRSAAKYMIFCGTGHLIGVPGIWNRAIPPLKLRIRRHVLGARS